MGLFDKFKKKNKDMEGEGLTGEQLSGVSYGSDGEIESGIVGDVIHGGSSEGAESMEGAADETMNAAAPVMEEPKKPNGAFVLGVENLYYDEETNDAFVSGRLGGTLELGMIVHISNHGEDNYETFLANVLEIEADRQMVESASDCNVIIRLEDGQSKKLRVGSVVHSRNVALKSIHEAYVNAIGEIYIGAKKFDLHEEELAQMSIADLTEAWRMNNLMKIKDAKEGKEIDKDAEKAKVEKLAKVLCEKILESEEIYVVYNKLTGEPHMFSKTFNRGDGTYMCAPPDILVIPKAYAKLYAPMYTNERFELKKIENIDGNKGIYNFLGGAFYLNGACGIDVVSDKTSIMAHLLVPKPDYSNVANKASIPVTNPELVRWMLLIGQMGKPEGEDAELIYRLYYRFMSIEMTKARFIIPMKSEGGMPEPDENGKTVIKKDTKIGLATIKGKGDKQAIRMYTDWKRMRMVYDTEWNGLIQKASDMIETFDLAVNVTQFPTAGCYVSHEMYEGMEKTVSQLDNK